MCIHWLVPRSLSASRLTVYLKRAVIIPACLHCIAFFASGKNKHATCRMAEGFVAKLDLLDAVVGMRRFHVEILDAASEGLNSITVNGRMKRESTA